MSHHGAEDHLDGMTTIATAEAATTWRSDVSSNVTSLSLTSQRSADTERAPLAPVLETASQLIAELQVLLRDDGSDAHAMPSAAGREVGHKTEAMGRREMRTSVSPSSAERSPPLQPLLRQQLLQSAIPGGRPSTQPHQPQPRPADPHTLDLQACNGICVVFANFSSFLPDGGAGDKDGEQQEDVGNSQRAGQIRDSVTAVGQLFNSQLEFVVLIHWNKSRGETLQLLRQAAAAMSEGGRDCCFAFFLGRGGPDHFAAACGGRVGLTDILATLAVGQRARLPAFVFGELTQAASDDAKELHSSSPPRLNLPSNQMLLWTLGAPQVTDMLVDQLARSHLSGSKDVASTVVGIAEWIRRRGRDSGCGCRFLSKLDRLVYLASPDCI